MKYYYDVVTCSMGVNSHCCHNNVHVLLVNLLVRIRIHSFNVIDYIIDIPIYDARDIIMG